MTESIFLELLKYLKKPKVTSAIAINLGLAYMFVRETFLVDPQIGKLKLLDKDKKEIPLDIRMKTLVDEIVHSVTGDIDDKNVLTVSQNANRVKTRVFYTHRIDPVHLGSSNSRQGGAIGIPFYTQYRTVEDVVNGKFAEEHNSEIDFQSESGKYLAESFILSDNAVKFILMRERQYCHNYAAMAKALVLLANFLPAYYLIYYLASRKNFNRTFKRWFIYTIFGGICITFFVINLSCLDMYSRYWDKKVDRKITGKMSEDIVRGGIECYDKSIKRHQILQEILGEDWNLEENEVEKFFRDKGWFSLVEYCRKFMRFLRPQPHVPLAARKEFLEKIMTKYDDTLTK